MLYRYFCILIAVQQAYADTVACQNPSNLVYKGDLHTQFVVVHCRLLVIH